MTDICVISCLFNRTQDATGSRNLEAFKSGLRRNGVPLYLLELTNDEDDTRSADGHIRLFRKNRDLIWQKERLLNILVNRIPSEFKKVIFADADIVFPDRNWVNRASAALDEYAVIQPYSTVMRLSRDSTRRYLNFGTLPPDAPAPGRRQEIHNVLYPCFSVYPEYDPTSPYGTLGFSHGHTGFAWGYRRDFLRDVGFYDAAISGQGDHLMAHAFSGELSSKCIVETFAGNSAYAGHFLEWARRAFAVTRGRIGNIPDTIYHLWHGRMSRRRNVASIDAFRNLGFDPTRDIRQDAAGCWEWTGQNPPLMNWLAGHLRDRAKMAE